VKNVVAIYSPRLLIN